MELLERAEKFYEAERLEDSEIACRKAIKLSDKLEHPDDSRAKVSAYLQLGFIYSKLIRVSDAEGYFEQAIEHINKLNSNEVIDQDLRAAIYNGFATLYGENDIYDKALEYMQHAKHIYEELAESYKEYRIEYAMLLSNMGLLYAKIDEHEAARTELFAALKIYDTCNANPEIMHDIANCYVNTAVYFMGVDAYSDAEYYLKKALNLYKKLQKNDRNMYKSEIATVLLDLAIANGMLNRKFRALWLAKKATRLRTKLAIQNPEAHGQDLAQCYMTQARIFTRLHCDGYAIQNFSFASEILKRQPEIDYDSLIEAYISMGSLYGSSKRHVKIALNCYSAAYQAAQKHDITERELAEIHADILTNTGNAYKTLRQYQMAEQNFMQSNILYASQEDAEAFGIEIAMNYLSAAEMQAYQGQENEAEESVASAKRILQTANIPPERHQERDALIKIIEEM